MRPAVPGLSNLPESARMTYYTRDNPWGGLANEMKRNARLCCVEGMMAVDG